jgi:hypothetical protein
MDKWKFLTLPGLVLRPLAPSNIIGPNKMDSIFGTLWLFVFWTSRLWLWNLSICHWILDLLQNQIRARQHTIPECSEWTTGTNAIRLEVQHIFPRSSIIVPSSPLRRRFLRTTLFSSFYTMLHTLFNNRAYRPCNRRTLAKIVYFISEICPFNIKNPEVNVFPLAKGMLTLVHRYLYCGDHRRAGMLGSACMARK